jgi:hypothetical protein
MGSGKNDLQPARSHRRWDLFAKQR